VRLLHLLAGSLVLRPYVFVFLAVYLFAAVTRLGGRRAAAFTLLAWAVAYAAEFSSTRTGFPFGFYVYLDVTRDRELWLANVPFFDSLSFTFLCYLGYALALFLYSPLAVSPRDFQVLDTPDIRASRRVLLTGAFFVMLIDVVIDPLTLRGDRWFLGRIYYYPGGGIHFGVPLSNYGGWFLVALVTIGLYQRLDRRVPRSRDGPRHVRYGGLLEPAVYLGILVFNLTLTFWIGETLLGLLGCMLYAPVVVLFLSHPLNPMRRKETTVTYAVLLVAVLAAGPAAALTGREVIDRAQQQNGFSTWRDRRSAATMETYDKGALGRVRDVDITEQTEPRGEHRTFMEFTAPADTKGTRFLHVSPRGEKDQQWLWTPSTRRVRRLGDAQRDENFFGTDLSYRDLELIVRIQQWNDDEAKATLASDEELDGKPCHVVELVPKNKEFPYSRYRLWFATADSLLWRVDVYDLEDRLFKRVSLDHYERLGRYATAMESDVATVPYGTHTTYKMRDVRYDTEVPASVFDVANMEGGR